MGLEALVLEEVRQTLPVVHHFVSHRNVLAAVDAVGQLEYKVQQLRTADDVYRYVGCCHGIDRTRPSVDKLIGFFEKVLLPQLPSTSGSPYVRLTFSFVGKRNFSRFFVENRFNELVTRLTRLQALSNEREDGKMLGELRLRCHLEGETAFVGIGLSDTPLHRRPWRELRYTGQLHPPVAAAMARLLQPTAELPVIDPFCGSGTILIESALQYPTIQHLGYDLQLEALEVARECARQAGTQVFFQQQDSLAWHPQADSYYLLSNPPWDEKHPITDADFVKTLANLLRNSEAAVLLLPEEMVQEIRRISSLPLQQIAHTRVRGKLASLIQLRRH